MCLTTFTNSLRRSSVSGGKVRRIEMPSLLGLSPRSDCWMAFSMAPIDALVVGRDQRAAGLGHREAGELLQRHLGAVVVDRELLDEGRGGPAGADRWRTRPGCGRRPCAIFSVASSRTTSVISVSSPRWYSVVPSAARGAHRRTGGRTGRRRDCPVVARGSPTVSGPGCRRLPSSSDDVALAHQVEHHDRAGRCPCRA